MAPVAKPLPPDENRAWKLLVMYWVEYSIGVIVVALRFYSRIKLRSIGLDDWTMLFTMVLVTIPGVLATLTASHGGARHLYYLHITDISTVLKLNWMTQTFGIISLAAAKISVACVMLRIISSTDVWCRRFLYFCMVSTFAFSTSGAILMYVQCNPPRALWTYVPGGRCWDPRVQLNFAIFSASWNAFMDVCLALLPISIIWKLHMAVRKKLGLCILLGLGIFAGICAMIKTSKLAGLSVRSDLTWATFDLFAWTAAELFCLIICGSIPTLKPLYDQLIKKCTRPASAGSGKKPLVYHGGMQQAYPPPGYPRGMSKGSAASEPSTKGDAGDRRGISSIV